MSNQEREEGQPKQGQPKLPHETFNLSIDHINPLEIMQALQKPHAEKQEQQQKAQEQEHLQKLALKIDKLKLQQQSELQHSKQLENKHSPEWLQSKEQQNQNYQHKQKEQSPVPQSDKFMDSLHQHFQNQHKAKQKLPSQNELIQNLFQQPPVPLNLQNEAILNLHQQSLVTSSLKNEFIQILHQQHRQTLLHEINSQLRNETPFQTSQRELLLQYQQFIKYLQELFRSQLEQLQLRHNKEFIEKAQRNKQEIEYLSVLQNHIHELRSPQISLSGQNHQEKFSEFHRIRLINLHIKQQNELENRQAQELQQEMQNQLRLMESQQEIYEFIKNKVIEDGVQIDI